MISLELFFFFFWICRYEKQLERFGRFMDTLLDAAPPESLQGDSSFNDKLSNKLHKSAFWARCLRQAASLGQKDMVYGFLSLNVCVIHVLSISLWLVWNN